MTNKATVTITSKRVHELSSNITVDNLTYHVQTEDMGKKSCKIITNVFLKGEIVASKKSDYAHLIKVKDFDTRISDIIEKHHKSVIAGFVADQSNKQKRKSDYFAEVQQLLQRGKGRQALDTLQEGLECYPADPFLLSYYGCLIAIVENNPKEGIAICENSLEALDTAMPYGSEFFYPVFYLNLGRAYLKGGKKPEAIKAFQQGLKSDPGNNDILWEMRKLGPRKKPPVSFLKRGNPINKYIGLLLGKSTK
jgi:tetratricopeptide (TPR) repeat protein